MTQKTRVVLKAENAADFPDNTSQQISAADLRGQMDDTADSALFPEDIPALDLSAGNVTSTVGGLTKSLADWTQQISNDAGGDVVGPAGATANNPTVFNGTSGKSVKETTYAAFKTSLAITAADVGGLGYFATGTLADNLTGTLAPARIANASLSIAQTGGLQAALDAKAASATTLAGYGITDAQPLDATLTTIAGLATVADRAIYFTGTDVAALTTQTAYARTILDDPDAATARGTLGLATIAASGSASDLGTGTLPAARIANNSLPLATLINATATARFLMRTTAGAGAWEEGSPANAKAALAIANTDVSGLGTMSTQNASAVAITGGTASALAITASTFANTSGTDGILQSSKATAADDYIPSYLMRTGTPVAGGGVFINFSPGGGAATRAAQIGGVTRTGGVGSNGTDLVFRTNPNGAPPAERGYFGTVGGFVVGTPTGTDKGAGSINATTLYQNGTALGTMATQNIAGLTGKMTTFASTTAAAALNLPVGVAPTSPVDGDIWLESNTNTGLKIRIAGVTKTVTLA